MSTSLPTSWQYGSFYGNSRLYNSKPGQSCDFEGHHPDDVPKDLVNEDYFRVLNQYNNSKEKDPKETLENELTFTHAEEAPIELPRETVYMIDRVVRQRTSRAKLAPHVHNEHVSLNIRSEEDYLDSSVKRGPHSQMSREGSMTRSQKAGLTFEEWFRQKEVERKLKERLIEDAMTSCKQIKEDFTKQKEEEKEHRQMLVDEWIQVKNKEIKQKKKAKKIKKQQQNRQKQMKKEYAQKAFREWLKNSLK